MLQTKLAVGHFVAGQLVEVEADEYLDLFRPATGEVLARAPIGTEADVERALVNAEKGFREWAAFSPADKERVLYRIAELLTESADSLAELEGANTGKRLEQAKADVEFAASVFRFYAGYPTKNRGDVIPTGDPEVLCYTSIEPVGVVAAVTPWNYPLIVAVAKVAPALAAGCAVVLKPAPETPLTALELARLACEAGLPAGALNVVTGDDKTGEALVSHPRIAKVSFTGSTAAGRTVMAAAGANGRPGTMELGGKSPNIVFDDVDLEASLDGILMGALTNTGQECCAGARILVHDVVFERFVSIATKRIRSLAVGADSELEIGPLISARHRERVAGFVDRAVAEGATIAAQGEVPQDGFYYPPTMLVDAESEMEVCREEIFGPVITVQRFGSDEEALEMANDTVYGLAAGIWTASIGRALEFARRLEAGLVWINSYLSSDTAAPFGGTKDSGFGREMGLEAPREFSQVKTVYVKAPPGEGRSRE